MLHSSLYGALLWICGYNSADYTPVLWLLLSIACTASRFHFSPLCPLQQVGQGWGRSWEGTQLGQLARTDQRDIPGHTPSCSAKKTEGRVSRGLHLGGGDSLCMHCSPYPPFLHLLNCLYLNPSFLTSVPILFLIPL